MKSLLIGPLVSLVLILPREGNTEGFDPFSQNGAELTASIMALFSLGIERWSCFFDQIAAQLRWIRFSYQAAILMGSVWLAWTSSGVKMPWVEWGRSAL
jgi:hypothetical protein